MIWPPPREMLSEASEMSVSLNLVLRMAVMKSQHELQGGGEECREITYVLHKAGLLLCPS